MKLIVSIVVIFILTTTCSYKCVQPLDSSLSSTVRDWLVPYKKQNFLLFGSQQGDIDTLSIQYKMFNEFCGGEECGTLCESEQILLTSSSNKTIVIRIDIRLNNLLAINNDIDSKYLYISYDVKDKSIFQKPSAIRVEYFENYTYKGSFIHLLSSDCTSLTSCDKLLFPSYKISQELGLIEYGDDKGKIWKRL
ncbi:hypothetical protein [Fibrella aquatilis]|uniref:Uncharacterized protein n=1 Tax=Fibrella aquatilis TaxID=2817059 RepID=A0A939G8A6_9BACT|nr:hypothetical protein [Fibrella aquatilis]MBO0931911.1 hypothetical protein [Fibrella aquatilis]